MNAIQIKVANFIDCKLGLGTGTGWKGGAARGGAAWGREWLPLQLSKGDFL